MTIEIRVLPAGELRVERRADEPPVIVGYAAVFNKLSEEIWGFREQIARGAFDDVLEDDVRALFNHDPNYVLGRSQVSQTLTLEQDDKGLRMEVEPPSGGWVDSLLQSIERKDITGQSFSFIVSKDSWEYDRDQDLVTRTILKLGRLYDVGPVTFPAYPDTDVAVRSGGISWASIVRVDPELRTKAAEIRAAAAVSPLALQRRRLQLAELDA